MFYFANGWRYQAEILHVQTCGQNMGARKFSAPYLEPFRKYRHSDFTLMLPVQKHTHSPRVDLHNKSYFQSHLAFWPIILILDKYTYQQYEYHILLKEHTFVPSNLLYTLLILKLLHQLVVTQIFSYYFYNY